MENKKFDALLEKAHAEIQNAEGVDEKGREILLDLERDIRELLDRIESQSPERSVTQRLKDAIDQFEISHPTLTAALSEISKILNNAGI